MRPRFAFIFVLAVWRLPARGPKRRSQSRCNPPPPPKQRRPAGGRLFVTNEVSGDISVIDVAAQKVVNDDPGREATARHPCQPRWLDAVRRAERLADCRPGC